MNARGKYLGLLLALSLVDVNSGALADGSDGELDALKDPNVQWSFVSNIAACPAGDSVVNYRDARVIIEILYHNGFNVPKVGVPPESIWVVTWAQSGNVRPYDYGKPTSSDSAMVFADDSTSWLGRTRVTMSGLGGCGTLGLALYVSGELKREGSVVVRTADTNGDGLVTSADTTSACDLNYNYIADDKPTVQAHVEHWCNLPHYSEASLQFA